MRKYSSARATSPNTATWRLSVCRPSSRLSVVTSANMAAMVPAHMLTGGRSPVVRRRVTRAHTLAPQLHRLRSRLQDHATEERAAVADTIASLVVGHGAPVFPRLHIRRGQVSRGVSVFEPTSSGGGTSPPSPVFHPSQHRLSDALTRVGQSIRVSCVW